MPNLFSIKPCLPPIWKIALRYTFGLRSKGMFRVVAAFAVLGIMLGVFSLIVVNAVMNGFRSELISNLISSSGEALVLSKTSQLKSYHQIKAKLEALKQVKSVRPIISCWVLAEFKDKTSCWGLKASHGGATRKEGLTVSEGFLGSLGCKVGDQVHLTDLNSLLRGRPSIKRFKVEKVAKDTGFDEHLTCSIEAAASFAKAPEAASYLSISTLNPQKIDSTAQEISKLLPKGYYVRTWKDLNPQLLNALSIEKASMLTILSLIVVVGALNCLSTLVMLVESKKREIAILKTIGASTGEILMVFLLSGLLIGTISTAIGSGLACLLLCKASTIKAFLLNFPKLRPIEYFLDRLPLGVNWSETLIISAASIAISLLATLYPAYKAAKTEPVKILNASI